MKLLVTFFGLPHDLWIKGVAWLDRHMTGRPCEDDDPERW